MHKIQENEWGTEPVLKVDIQQAGYEPGRPRIRDISFQVAPGELLGLIGRMEPERAQPLRRCWGRLKIVKLTSLSQVSLPDMLTFPATGVL